MAQNKRVAAFAGGTTKTEYTYENRSEHAHASGNVVFQGCMSARALRYPRGRYRYISRNNYRLGLMASDPATAVKIGRTERGAAERRNESQEVLMKSGKLWSRIVLAGTLSGALALVFSATVRADRDWRDDCRRRLESDRTRIDRDASRHGERSRHVDHDVARMNSHRQWCRDHKADWDHDHFDNGIYFGHHDDDHHEEHHDDHR